MPLFDFKCPKCGKVQEDICKNWKDANNKEMLCLNCSGWDMKPGSMPGCSPNIYMEAQYPLIAIKHTNIDKLNFFDQRRVDARRKECGVDV